jgi:hypothetical protein
MLKRKQNFDVKIKKKITNSKYILFFNVIYLALEELNSILTNKR